jgi:hypothetical protein
MKPLALAFACFFAHVGFADTQDFDGKFSVTYQPEQWTVDLEKNSGSQQGVRLKRPDGTNVTVAVIPTGAMRLSLNDPRDRASMMRGMGNEKITSAEAASRIKSVSVFDRPGYELTGITEINGKPGSYRAVMVPRGTDAIFAILVTPASDPMAVPELKTIWDSIKVSAAPAPDPATTFAPGDLPALRVVVTSVNESRSRSSPGTGGVDRSTINLSLSVLGEGLPPTAAVKQINVTKAVDNLGNVLGSSMAGMPGSLSMSRMISNLSRGRLGAPLTGETSLDGSTRKAESLQYVEGTIELFLPSEASGSIVRIPNVLSHAGRIEDPALAKQGIEYYFLPNQTSYDEAKGLAGFQARATPPDFPNGVGYFLRDPSGRWAGQQFQEANGTALPPGGSSSSGGAGGTQTGALRPRAPLPSDVQLVIYLAIPEAIETVPFRVEDIALP